MIDILVLLQLITDVSSLDDDGDDDDAAADDDGDCDEDLSTDHVGSTVDIRKFSY